MDLLFSSILIPADLNDPPQAVSCHLIMMLLMICSSFTPSPALRLMSCNVHTNSSINVRKSNTNSDNYKRGIKTPPQICEKAARQGRAISEWSHMIQTAALLPHPTCGVLVRLHRGQTRASAVNVWVCAVHVKLQLESHLAATHMSTNVCFHWFCIVFLHDLYIFLHLEASYSFIPSFLLESGNGLSHSPSAKKKHAKKTRAQKSFRQMAAAFSSGRGGHGCCPETARGTDWSETQAGSPVSLLSPKMMLSRPQPHVTMLPGCWAEKSQILFGPCAPQAAEVQCFSITYSPVLTTTPTAPLLQNTIGPGMQVRQSHRHFKANKLHPAAVEKAGIVCVCVCVCVCVLGGCTKHCHLLLLYCCQLFGLWESGGGWGFVALGCLFILQPNISPSRPSVPKLAFGYRVVGTHLKTHTHTHTNEHTTTSFPPPLPVITLTPRGSAQRVFKSIIRRVISRLCVCVFLCRGRVRSDPLRPSTPSCDHIISPLSLMIEGGVLKGCLQTAMKWEALVIISEWVVHWDPPDWCCCAYFRAAKMNRSVDRKKINQQLLW